MQVEHFVCPPRAGCPFHTTAKRYWLPEFAAHSADSDALTLILLHSTSFHKETWEPSLNHIFWCSVQLGSSVKLREAWMLDCPNHGEAAMYNEAVLRRDEHKEDFSCQKYATAVQAFLTAGINEGAKIDFTSRRLVGIGHSLGANTILLLQQYKPRLPFSSLVIVEPMVSPDGPPHLESLGLRLISRAFSRKNVWPSREEARHYFLTNSITTRDWDKRVVNLFVDYGLRDLEGRDVHPNCVTLACTYEQEVAMYRDVEGITSPVRALDEISPMLPVHLILGRPNDLIPANVHQAILDTTSSGRRYASIKYIEDAGHLVPQKKPEELGMAVFAALCHYEGKARL